MLSIIVAIAKNNAIGKDNRLLCHIPADLKRFKAITTGKKLLMGRKTFDSLPGVLANRPHIVVSKSAPAENNDPRVSWTNNPLPLFKKYGAPDCAEEIFVIGGASLYAQALPFCDKLYLTYIEEEFEADTFFPAWDEKEWTVAEKSELLTDEKNGLQFYYETLTRVR
jgi:dihydrofolate reductase